MEGSQSRPPLQTIQEAGNWFHDLYLGLVAIVLDSLSESGTGNLTASTADGGRIAVPHDRVQNCQIAKAISRRSVEATAAKDLFVMSPSGGTHGSRNASALRHGDPSCPSAICRAL